jgi:(1->4)-alpha-D-glucan 1-alpha-D-glucosylmutase
VQFTDKFVFRQALDIVDYLADLGVSDLYASPIFQAKNRSVSGYDVVNPLELNVELGTMEDFEALSSRIQSRGMGWLQDIVPNHMGYYGANKMLADVLEKGPASKYYNYFDIDWNHPYESLKGRLLAPFLGRFYGEALESGEIQLNYCENGFVIHYYDFNYPLRIESYATVLTHNWGKFKKRLGGDDPDLIKLCGILYVLKNLPPKEEAEDFYDQIAFVKRILWELYTGREEIKELINGNMEAFNGRQGEPGSFELLNRLLAEQFFRLSYWKVATEEIDYRRFFTINDLISVNVEHENVFNDTHSLIFKMVQDGKFTGLRVDHIDGLHDPTRYLERLKERAGGDVYILVEKILELGEELPSFWPIQGTTGYEFINFLNGIFCDERNGERFSKFYRNFVGFAEPYEKIWYDNKKLIVEKHMTGDKANLARLLKSALSEDRYGGDITLYGFETALAEVMAHFPVYRTYITRDALSSSAKGYVETAIKRAKASLPDFSYELDYIRKVLLLEMEDYLSEEEKNKRIHFTMRFQQFTGPLMAKGFEDTTLYEYNRFVSLNEVGGAPDRFGITLKEFNDFNAKRAAQWPHAMSASATHDTKRGEDTRARLNVLSEMPDEWEQRVERWSELNDRLKKHVDGECVLDKNTEYFLYQALVGALPFTWPVDSDFFIFRMKEYMFKSVREAKVHSEWVNPNIVYEEAVFAFIEDILNPMDENPFLEDFAPFQRKVASYGIWNSLSQTLIKFAASGVPDIYQGTELWDLSLVDPDNRRPVDYAKRKAILADILEREKSDISRLSEDLLSTKEDGRVKLFLVHRALLARKNRAKLFQDGAYTPLEATGRHDGNIVAFARRNDDAWGLCITPRFLTSMIEWDELPIGEKVWEDTYIELPGGAPATWRDAITGQIIEGDRKLPLGLVFRHFPAALLLG